MNKPPPDDALWKLSVLGPLVSARLEHGDRTAWFHEIAARLHQRPDGRLVQLSPRTVEAWYYAYRYGGLAALQRRQRSDRGHSRALSAESAKTGSPPDPPYTRFDICSCPNVEYQPAGG